MKPKDLRTFLFTAAPFSEREKCVAEPMNQMWFVVLSHLQIHQVVCLIEKVGWVGVPQSSQF